MSEVNETLKNEIKRLLIDSESAHPLVNSDESKFDTWCGAGKCDIPCRELDASDSKEDLKVGTVA